MPRWVYPVDPECESVAEFRKSLLDDPMTEAMGAPVGEIMEDFERKHRAECERCQAYAAANVDVE